MKYFDIKELEENKMIHCIIGESKENLLLDKIVDEQTSVVTLERNFTTTAPNQKWTTDVSMFKISAGKLYLSPIMDMFDHSIISYDISITADFNEGLYGSHLFILAPELTQKLAGLINKEDAPEIDGMSLSVVSEVVSQHTGNEITNISNTGKFPGLACNPAEANHVPKAMVHFPQGSFVLFSYPLTIDGSVFTLWEIMGEEVAKSLIVAFGGGKQETPKADNSFGQMSSPAGQPQMNGMPQMQMGGMPQMQMGGMQMGMPQMQMGGMQMGGMPQMQMGTSLPWRMS